MSNILFALSIQELDFIVQRLTSGQMDYQTALNVNILINKIQKQANDPAIQKDEPHVDHSSDPRRLRQATGSD